MRLIARSLVRHNNILFYFFFHYFNVSNVNIFFKIWWASCLVAFLCCSFFFRFISFPAEDNFNLYGLRNEIPHFRSCLNVILDISDHSSMDPKTEASLDQHVMDLYGLIHARYILTKRGMDRMVSVLLLWVVHRVREVPVLLHHTN